MVLSPRSRRGDAVILDLQDRPGRIAQLELTPFLRTSNGSELIAPVAQAFEARPGIWVRPPP
jgi:hypothetical protein